MIHVHELDVLKLMKIWDSFWCKNPDPYKMTRNRIYVYRLYPIISFTSLDGLLPLAALNGHVVGVRG